MKSSHNPTDQSAVLQESNIDRPPGLRERQKEARYERILAGARSLFNTMSFEKATMAAIAEHAGVSTPTVFNYFNTKDQLLLALVLQVHHQTQAWVHNYQPQPSSSLSDAICDFLGMYTKASLKTINRQTWRHVESTRIRMPDSDFVKEYDVLTEEMFDDFYVFLMHTIKDQTRVESSGLKSVAEIIFYHWSALFVEIVRNEKLTLDEHFDRLRTDLTALIGMMKIS